MPNLRTTTKLSRFVCRKHYFKRRVKLAEMVIPHFGWKRILIRQKESSCLNQLHAQPILNMVQNRLPPFYGLCSVQVLLHFHLSTVYSRWCQTLQNSFRSHRPTVVSLYLFQPLHSRLVCCSQDSYLIVMDAKGLWCLPYFLFPYYCWLVLHFRFGKFFWLLVFLLA